MGNASTEAAHPAPAPDPEAPRLEAEALITAHRIFAALDGQKKSLRWLHGDLFDSRLPVTLSALETVGTLADPSSLPLLARLLTGTKEDVQCGAVRALGRLRTPKAVTLLMELIKTARSEKVRREILEALATCAAHDRQTVGLLRQTARAAMVSAAARGHAAGLLLKIGAQLALEELLPDTREEITEQILVSATENPVLVPRTVSYYAPLYERLPSRGRATLTTLASRQALPESSALLRHALSDQNAEVRRAAYAALGTEPHHAPLLADVMERLAEYVETNPALEDEAQQALVRAQALAGVADAITPLTRAKVVSRITDLYKQLTTEGRHVSSDTHELGWLITRSKEYVEYYGDEEFKGALLRWLKGASSDTEQGLLKQLKCTAARVEVRHFDGYQALTDLIKNPKRAGIALVMREISLARTGKSKTFWHLVRAIRIATVFLTPEPNSPVAVTLRAIYAWARQEKLFRLAEAALLGLARADSAFALAACKDHLTIPLASKVLAIASLHLLHDLAPARLEPSATRLLVSMDDPYVTLNAIETITAGPPTSSAELARALLTRVSLAATGEVRDSAAGYLGEKVVLDITESLKDLALSGDDSQRAAALSILERRLGAGLVTNRDGTVEFLFRILRGEHAPSRRSAALMLWKLGDDYAPEVLRDFLASGAETETIEILTRLSGVLRETLLPSLAGLLPRGSAPLQEALRALLLSVQDVKLREKVLAIVMGLRGASTEEEEDLSDEETTPAVDLRTERASFQFEHEFIQELVMFFSDIVGYSKKAQLLTPMQLSSLIQEYEKLLLAHVNSHRGELIKRMGDGHMIIFQRPLDAVLAAVRMQKSLRRFNRYRDENSRVMIRIGIHSGKVVRKEKGDVLGNAVNIASRLESSARPGSILISDKVQDAVKDAIHAREIGHITVKNISEPIRVFEPYEIVLDLPPELDPLRTPAAPAAEMPAAATAAATAAAPPAPGRNTITMDAESWSEIVKCFSALAAACRGAAGGQIAVAAVNDQVLARWDRIKGRLGAGAATTKRPGSTPAGE
jgi:class 3 adenylate cyclase/HEAT repeat protein